MFGYQAIGLLVWEEVGYGWVDTMVFNPGPTRFGWEAIGSEGGTAMFGSPDTGADALAATASHSRLFPATEASKR